MMHTIAATSSPTGSTVPSWVHSQRWSLFIVVSAAVLVRSLTFGTPDLHGNDEEIYGIYVRTFGEHGIDGLRQLVHQHNADPSGGLGPLPFRIGYIWAGWLSCKLFGGYSLQNIAWISFLSSIARVGVGFLLLRQWLSPRNAFVAGLLMVASPLGMGMSRRALQESLVAFLFVLSMYLYHQWWCRQKQRDLLALGVAVLAGLLVKESMFLMFPSFAIVGFYYSRRFGHRRIFPLVITLLAALVADFFVVDWIAGGLDVAFLTYATHGLMMKHNLYAMTFEQGPWFSYLILFLLVSPLTYALSIVGAVSSPKSEEERMGRDLAVLYVVSGLVLFTLTTELNVRFVLYLTMPLHALSALGICSLTDRIKSSWRSEVAMLVLVLAILGSDLDQYYRIFIRTNVYDPFGMNLFIGDGFWK